MRGQRGRLPVQPLGYVMSTKVIFRRVEVFRDVRMQVNLGLMFERKAKISCNGGRSGLDVCACGRLGRQTSARTKTFLRLKITFVDMTYPGQRPKPPSLSPHFLLTAFIRKLPSQLGSRKCHVIADSARPVTHGPKCAIARTVAPLSC